MLAALCMCVESERWLRGYEALVISGQNDEQRFHCVPWKQEVLLIDYGLGSSEDTDSVCVCVRACLCGL